MLKDCEDSVIYLFYAAFKSWQCNMNPLKRAALSKLGTLQFNFVVHICIFFQDN